MKTTQIKEAGAPQVKEADLREQIKTLLNRLSVERLRVALDFLDYLNNKASEEATQELLAISNFEKDLAEAEREIERGEYIDWEQLKKEA